MNRATYLIKHLKNNYERIGKFYVDKHYAQDKAIDFIVDKIKKTAQIMLNLKKFL